MRLTRTILLVAAAAAPLLAQACGDRPQQQPAALGPDATGELARALDGWRASADPATGVEIPAANAAVVLADGRTTVVASSRASSNPLQPSSIFRLASVSKLFTATVVVQLAQEGRLSLDDPISRWVSYPNGEHVTVAMLLSHTSGIPNLPDDLEDRDWTPLELIDAVAARGGADFAPGTSWTYSNTSYLILGVIIERVTGRAWHEEVRARIVEPLGLASTYAWGQQNGPEPIVGYDLHCTTDDGEAASEATCIGRSSRALAVKGAHEWKFAWSAGALVASAGDVATFIHALVAGDLLDDAHRERMLTPVPVTVAYMKDAYARSGARQLVLGVGLGPWLYDVEGVGRAWGHAGSIAGFNNSVLYYPEHGFGVVVLNALMAAGRETYAPGAAAVGGAALHLVRGSE